MSGASASGHRSRTTIAPCPVLALLRPVHLARLGDPRKRVRWSALGGSRPGDLVAGDQGAAADAVQKGIVDGTLHPFTGELKDQKGVVRLKAGEKASDELMSKMDWYVDGVQA